MWEKIVLNLLSNAFKFTFEGGLRSRLQGGRRSRRAARHRYRRRHSRGRAAAHVRAFPPRRSTVGRARTKAPASDWRWCRSWCVSTAAASPSRARKAAARRSRSRSGQGPRTCPPSASARRAPPSTPDGAIPFVEEALRWLPVGDGLTVQEAAPIDGRDAHDQAPATAARVLVADDNADMRDYLAPHSRRALSRRDRRRRRAPRSSAFATEAPDLVLADVMMPALDGFGLIAAIRADERIRSLPVILLSARAGKRRASKVCRPVPTNISSSRSARGNCSRASPPSCSWRVCGARPNACSAIGATSIRRCSTRRRSRVYVLDADFRICEVNSRALPVFGDIPGGVLGRDFDEVAHILWEKECADEAVRIFRHTLPTGEPYVSSDRNGFRHDRGATEDYEWRVDRITLPDGRFGLVCYFRDISEQKKALAAKAYLAAIVDSAEDAIISKNLDGDHSVVQRLGRAPVRLYVRRTGRTAGPHADSGRASVGGRRHPGAVATRRTRRTLRDRPHGEGWTAARCRVDDLAGARRLRRDHRRLEDRPRHHGDQAGGSRAAAAAARRTAAVTRDAEQRRRHRRLRPRSRQGGAGGHRCRPRN